MILVDTSVWIDYIKGKHTPQVTLLEDAMEHNLLVVGDLILTELLQGFKSDKVSEEVKKLLMRCQYRDIGGYDIAIASAKNYRTLRSKGLTVRKTIDVLIGTFCIENGIWLLHNDRDFDPMEEHLGLKVVR